jgi:hypothetical protein
MPNPPDCVPPLKPPHVLFVVGVVVDEPNAPVLLGGVPNAPVAPVFPLPKPVAVVLVVFEPKPPARLNGPGLGALPKAVAADWPNPADGVDAKPPVVPEPKPPGLLVPNPPVACGVVCPKPPVPPKAPVPEPKPPEPNVPAVVDCAG